MRSTMILLLAAGFAIADPKPGEEGTPEFQKAAALVKQLGDKRYAVRESAAKQLVEMGPAAVPALTAGTKSEDEEVRNRSVALLPQAKAAAWKRLAAAYLADTEAKQKHELPLLEEWEKLTGKPDAGSRKLFAEMVKANGEMLDKAADRRVAASACMARCKVVLAQAKGPKGQIKAEIGDVASILFVDTLIPTRSDWSTRAFPAQLLSNPTAAETVGDADMGPAFRRLVVKWMQARDKNDPTPGQQFALFARKKPFAEAAPILIKLAKEKTADVFTVRVLAIEALGKIGGKDAAAALADLVPETTNLFGGGGQDQNRVGDVALAASLAMHGKKLSDFGMNNNFGIGFSSGDGEEPISITLHGFQNQAARDKAVKKWKEEVVEKKEAKKEEKKEEKKDDKK
jgi:hypothetical protein